MKATLHTNHGPIVVELFPNEAPRTVANFTGLATGSKEYRDDAGRTNPTKFYDGLVFHRIIPGFMIQGGCPLGSGMAGPGYTFDDEIHPDKQFDRPYLLAMANAGKRMGKGTNGSQFFITVGATPGSTASTRSSARWPTAAAARSSTPSPRCPPAPRTGRSTTS